MQYASSTLALLAVATCEVTKPYRRKGIWRWTRTNDAGIAAQIIPSSDLLCGIDYAPHDSTMPAAAIGRYRAGKIKKLPDSSLVAIGTQSTGNDGSATAVDVITGDTVAVP